MARRTQSAGDTITSAALKGVKALDKWIDDNPVEIKGKDGNVKGTTVRKTTVQADVPHDVYVAMVQAASQIPNAMEDGDLKDGFLARVLRQSVLPNYTNLKTIEEINAWEDERAAVSSARRKSAMSEAHAIVKTYKKEHNTMEKLRERAAANPELAALLASLNEDDNDS